MGYGVLDVCKKELHRVQEIAEACEQKLHGLEELKTKLQKGEYDIYDLPSYNRQMRHVLVFLDDSLKISDSLANRLNEILETAPVLNQVSSINLVIDTNHELCRLVGIVQKDVGDVTALIESDFHKYYCQKSNTLCPNLDCKYRNDPMEKKYARELRWRHFLNRLHLWK